RRDANPHRRAVDVSAERTGFFRRTGLEPDVIFRVRFVRGLVTERQKHPVPADFDDSLTVQELIVQELMKTQNPFLSGGAALPDPDSSVVTEQVRRGWFLMQDDLFDGNFP